MHRMIGWIIGLLLLPTAIVLAQQDIPDIVYLKDGTMIRGLIVEQKPEDYIKIRKADGMIVVYEMKDILNIEKFKIDSAVAIKAVLRATYQEKDPEMAFILSLVLPGLGQYYNGQILKGILQEVLYFGSASLAMITWFNALNEEDESILPYSISFTALAVGSYLWSVIDAPNSAHKINERARIEKFGHLMEFGNDRYCLGFDMGTSGRRVGASLILHF